MPRLPEYATKKDLTNLKKELVKMIKMSKSKEKEKEKKEKMKEKKKGKC